MISCVGVVGKDSKLAGSRLAASHFVATGRRAAPAFI